ncbi:MAG: hypothetical protein C0498_04155 [Anaerolinea sp.]|nr:hypothetical protein [Anaerolinea sp.]
MRRPTAMSLPTVRRASHPPRTWGTDSGARRRRPWTRVAAPARRSGRGPQRAPGPPIATPSSACSLSSATSSPARRSTGSRRSSRGAGGSATGGTGMPRRCRSPTGWSGPCTASCPRPDRSRSGPSSSGSRPSSPVTTCRTRRSSGSAWPATGARRPPRISSSPARTFGGARRSTPSSSRSSRTAGTASGCRSGSGAASRAGGSAIGRSATSSTSASGPPGCRRLSAPRRRISRRSTASGISAVEQPSCLRSSGRRCSATCSSAATPAFPPTSTSSGSWPPPPSVPISSATGWRRRRSSARRWRMGTGTSSCGRTCAPGSSESRLSSPLSNRISAWSPRSNGVASSSGCSTVLTRYPRPNHLLPRPVDRGLEPPKASVTVALSAVDQLADAFWDRFLELAPISATVNGDHRWDDRLPDPGPEGRAKARSLAAWVRDEAVAIAADGLSVEERITRDMLRVVGEVVLEDDLQRIDVLQVVDHMAGPQTLLPQLAQLQPADTPERFEAFMSRLRAYPAFMAANRELLREALASGLTAPRIVVERTIAQLERMLAIPIDEAVVPAMAQVASNADREAIRAAVRDEVYPADAAFLEALEGDYGAAVRLEPGIWSAPNGEAIYRSQIRHWTTLDLDPAEVHQIGLEELASIDAERRVIARAAGFGDDTAAYRQSLTVDPRNIPASRQALVDRAMEDIDRANAAAAVAFGQTPRSACRVMPVEEYKEKDAPFAYYYPPTPDGSRPGTYYVNTYDLETRLFSRLAATTYHEATPGHHFQIALEVESTDLNRFRRFGSRIVGGAYVEGWGLYAERLADELGLYRDEAERFGMLDGQAWRAGRLVVDTGLHALRWGRQRSIDYLLNEVGLSPTDATIETDRYICWPAQALTYKVGQREIERLRRELAERDGAAFDLRSFHDELLAHGSLPLATLARELPGWVSARV